MSENSALQAQGPDGKSGLSGASVVWRWLKWGCLWALTLGHLELRVVYTDGLTIEFTNHWKRRRSARTPEEGHQ